MTMRVQVVTDKIDLADELEEEFLGSVKAAIGEAGNVLLREVRKKLRQRRGPEAAPAGEPPAEQTGELARSFRRIAPRVRGRVATSGVQSSHPGANRQEYGSIDSRGIRTLPHPYLGPSINDTEEEVTRILNDAIP